MSDEYEQMMEWIKRADAARPAYDSKPKLTAREWHVILNEEERAFRAELERVYGMAENPKAGMLYEIAWEYGHHAGYAEVLGYYHRLVELVR